LVHDQGSYRSSRTRGRWRTRQLVRFAEGPDSTSFTLSDNDAAAQLLADLGQDHGGAREAAAAVTELLRAAGDMTTVVSTRGRAGFSAYGQTEWSLPMQQRFMGALAGGCICRGSSRAYLLDRMGRVTSDTWGLGSAAVPALWKGGWGPSADGSYLVRQKGMLEADGRQLVVTIAARAGDGQFESSQALATEVARWVAENANHSKPVSGGC
jgi:hypothetical protein